MTVHFTPIELLALVKAVAEADDEVIEDICDADRLVINIRHNKETGKVSVKVEVLDKSDD